MEGKVNGKMNCVSYFAAGPSKLPSEVLLEIQKELVHYEDTNLSVMELSHRSPDFQKIIQEAEKVVREILNVPDNYEVLFMQGGGVGQFSSVPMNLMSRTGKADYIVSGSWSAKAAKEGEKYGKVNLVLPSTKVYKGIPPQEEWNLTSDASYLYYCANETVEGVEFDFVPEALSGVPLVCDMSSNICTRHVDISKFGLIFAGAQKNLGCAGVTLVIVKDELLDKAFPYCPSIFDYSKISKQKSLLNTPPTFAVYVLKKVISWVLKQGGIEAMAEKSAEKSRILYDLIDHSAGFYYNAVSPQNRSRMNVTFRVGGPDGSEVLEKTFVENATHKGLLSLKGHRSVGGIRASMYNAVSLEDVSKLSTFMKSFMNDNKKV